ncbi:hypothetical protein GE061_005011 [Apolygus lucorum]|uniref:Attacin C-terminal domain-containing protein n=1 Tax=Apolygus lucorum TaxID=248454 RepID=A0A8S9WWS2_APOLU|nr:hypothetical protein GE061_005011 [Apolygus lucorum]
MKISMILLALAGVVLVCYAHPAPDGGITYGADHDQFGGVRPSVKAGHTWESNDKRTQAEVHGHWERTYGGRMNGDRNHGAGFSITHKW